MATPEVNEFFTLDAISEEVAQNYGSTDTETKRKSKRWVNRALLSLSRLKWSFLKDESTTFDTVSGTAEYALDASVKKIRQLYTRDPQRKLRLLGSKEFRRLTPDPTASTGTPTHYRNIGFNKDCSAYEVSLFPVPDSAVTVYVDADFQIPLMEDDDDDIREVSGVPQHMIDGIIQLATAYGFREQGDSRYARTKAEADAMIRELWEDDNAEDDDNMVHRAFSLDFDNRIGDPILPLDFS